MRIETTHTKVYTFDELSDKAKDKARDWYKQGNDSDNYWSESVIEDAATIAEILGIELKTHGVKLVNDTIRHEPCIWWSGFSSQGDGACFEGSYKYAKGSAKKIRSHAPKDEKLHRVADSLAAIQKRHGYKLQASVTHSGHYYHAYTMNAEITTPENATRETEETLTGLLRDFANWIYKALESEYVYVNADEQVDESIRANEYEFTAEGKIV